MNELFCLLELVVGLGIVGVVVGRVGMIVRVLESILGMLMFVEKFEVVFLVGCCCLILFCKVCLVCCFWSFSLVLIRCFDFFKNIGLIFGVECFVLEFVLEDGVLVIWIL